MDVEMPPRAVVESEPGPAEALRLHPAPSLDSARAWLTEQAVRGWGAAAATRAQPLIERVARDLVAVAGAPVPSEYEPWPLFVAVPPNLAPMVPAAERSSFR
jgi:hypothetical protein